jgi:hypothetical protein
MVFRVKRMIELLRSRMPAETEHMHVIYADPLASAQAYATLVPWNFSNRLLARIPEHLMVQQVEDVSWSDWGTPEAIHRTRLTFDLPPPWFVRQPEQTITAVAGR